MTESLPTQHPTWESVQEMKGEYQWEYEGVGTVQGNIIKSSAASVLGMGTGYDGIVVDSITINATKIIPVEGENLYQTIKKQFEGIDIGENGGLPVFYLNKITDLKPVVYGHYTHNVSDKVSGTNPLLQKQDSISSVCSTESTWSSSSGKKSIKDVPMLSIVTKRQTFAESPLYLQLEKDLETVAKYQELWEFFNEKADESGITFEQYTALVNLPVDIKTITDIIEKTRYAVADKKYTHYAFNREEYIGLIPPSENRRVMENAEAAIPNVLAGSIMLSYYKKATDKFSENHYLKPDGKVTSTKNPSSTYSYSGLNADGEMIFKLNQGSALASNVSRMGSSMGSSMGSTLKRGFSSMFSKSAAAAGGRRTRRKSKKSSTRKGGKRGGGRCRESCKMASKKRK